MAGTGMLLIGHGSRSAAGVAQFRAFADAVAEARPATAVSAGLIELAEPTLDEALDVLVAQGVETVVAVPLVLLGAGHLKDDGPAALTRGRARHRCLVSHYARDLGVHPAVLGVGEDRARAAGGDESDAVVVVGRGSTDPDANADLAKVARLLADRRGLGTGGDPGRELGLVEPAFVSLALPSLPEALERCHRLGARRITVLPWFLFTGVLPERLREQAARFTGEHPGTRVDVAEELGADPRIVALVWDRFDEALAGGARMNCDGCLYRAPLPGYEDRVGAPPFGR
jgi:sirohydrochlorin ferrochelatase